MIIIAKLDEYISEREHSPIELLEVLRTYLLFLVPRFLMLGWLEVAVQTTEVCAHAVKYYIVCHGVACGCSVLMMIIIMIIMIMMMKEMKKKRRR